MTQVDEDFEGGSNGGAINTGTIFSATHYQNGSSTNGVSNADPYNGSLHARLHIEGGYSLVGVTGLTASNYRVIRYYFTLNTGVPNFGSGTYLCTQGSTVNLDGWARIAKQSASTYRVSIGSGGSTHSSSTTDLNVGQRYRLEYIYDYGTTTQTLRIWTGDTLESSDDGDALITLSSAIGQSFTRTEVWFGPGGAPGDAVVGDFDFDGVSISNTGRLGPLGSMYTAPTEVTAGSPGSFDNDAPPDLATLQSDAPTAIPSTAWATNQYVVLGDASLAYWTGTAWAVGEAPVSLLLSGNDLEVAYLQGEGASGSINDMRVAVHGSISDPAILAVYTDESTLTPVESYSINDHIRDGLAVLIAAQ